MIEVKRVEAEKKSNKATRDELTLIHTKDNFQLKIGDKEIPFITGYTIVSSGENHNVVDLTLQVTLNIDKIEIGNQKCKLL